MIVLKNIIKKIIIKNLGNLLKFGIDPTSCSLHIGHVFLINFIFFLLNKKFNIIIIIGDFTTKIKKKINIKEIIINSICIKSQIFNIFGNIKIYFNSIWFSKIKIKYFFKLINYINFNKYVNKTIKKNFKNKKIFLNDFFYPILQAYDSIIINSDLEIGGQDQLLNIIIGRYFQYKVKKNKQNLLTLFLIKNNNKKISKSDNLYYINKNIKISYKIIEKIFFNIKMYNKLFFKKKNFLFFFLKKKIKNKIFINIYFINRNFLSFYFKFFLNKNNFFKYLYNKKIILKKKIIIKNIFLKKYKYFFKNFTIFIYDKFY